MQDCTVCIHFIGDGIENYCLKMKLTIHDIKSYCGHFKLNRDCEHEKKKERLLSLIRDCDYKTIIDEFGL